MLLYSSVYEYGEAEYVVQKSRFIAQVKPVESYDEAKAFVSEVREKYRDATHNVPALVCGPGQEWQWASDDGEPSGTSGLPVLKMITGEGLTDLAVVVTRYFGGIKLGTGGLARAYTAAARLGLDSAGRCDVMESRLFRCEFDYSYLTKLQSLAASSGGVTAGTDVSRKTCGSGSAGSAAQGTKGFELTEPEYSDVVRMGVRCLAEDADAVRGMLVNLTGGQVRIHAEESGILRVRR